MSKLAKNTAIYAIGDIIPKLLNLITFPIMTSNLSTGDFGIINYINSIEAFLTMETGESVNYWQTSQKTITGTIF